MLRSKRNSKRGNVIKILINNYNLIILNDNSPTHIWTHNTHTNTDISIATTDIIHELEWKILDDVHGSDHFPIIITTFEQSSINRQTSNNNEKMIDII